MGIMPLVTSVIQILTASCVLVCALSTPGTIAQEVGSTENKPVPVDSPECVGKPDGIYPNPSNCSNFLACSGNVTYVINCNEGLLFDAESSRCEWASKAVCAPGTEATTTDLVTEIPEPEPSTSEPELTPPAIPVNEEESLPIDPVTNAPESSTNPPESIGTTPENIDIVTEFSTVTPEPSETSTGNIVTESATTEPAPGPPENHLVFKNVTELNPLTDNLVGSGFNSMNESLYVCRAQYSPGVIIPGQTNLKTLACFVPSEAEGAPSEAITDFEVLTNPTNQRIGWLQSQGPGAKKLPPNTVVGGKFLSSKVYLFYVGRCILQVAPDTNPIVVPGSVQFNAFHFLYEAKVATEQKTYRCKNNFQILIYG